MTFGWKSLVKQAASIVACFVVFAGVASAANAQDPHPYRPGIDVLDYAITLDLPDTGSTIKADVMLTVKRTARVDTLVLDLRGLKVTKLTLDSKTRKYTRTDSTINISLPKGDSGTYRVHVYY